MVAKIAGPTAVAAAKGALERHMKQNLSNTAINSGATLNLPRVENPGRDLPTVDPTDTRIGTYDGKDRGLAKLLGALLVQNPNPPPPPAWSGEINPGQQYRG